MDKWTSLQMDWSAFEPGLVSNPSLPTIKTTTLCLIKLSHYCLYAFLR